MNIAPQYQSVNDILVKKYGHTDPDNEDFPDFRKKTVFFDKKGRDVSKSTLSYPQAERIIAKALNEPLE